MVVITNCVAAVQFLTVLWVLSIGTMTGKAAIAVALLILVATGHVMRKISRE